MKQHAVLFTEVCPPTAEKAGVIRALLRKFDQVYIVPIYFSNNNYNLNSFNVQTMFMHAINNWASDPMRLHRVHVVNPIVYLDVSKLPGVLDMCLQNIYEVNSEASLTAVFDWVEFSKFLDFLRKTMFFTHSINVCLYADTQEVEEAKASNSHPNSTILPIPNIKGKRSSNVLKLIMEGKHFDQIARLLGHAVYRYVHDNNLYNIRKNEEKKSST